MYRQYTINEVRVSMYLWWVGAVFAKWVLTVCGGCRWVLLLEGGGGLLRGPLRKCHLHSAPAPVLLESGCGACDMGGGGRRCRSRLVQGLEVFRKVVLGLDL